MAWRASGLRTSQNRPGIGSIEVRISKQRPVFVGTGGCDRSTTNVHQDNTLPLCLQHLCAWAPISLARAHVATDLLQRFFFGISLRVWHRTTDCFRGVGCGSKRNIFAWYSLTTMTRPVLPSIIAVPDPPRSLITVSWLCFHPVMFLHCTYFIQCDALVACSTTANAPVDLINHSHEHGGFWNKETAWLLASISLWERWISPEMATWKYRILRLILALLLRCMCIWCSPVSDPTGITTNHNGIGTGYVSSRFPFGEVIQWLIELRNTFFVQVRYQVSSIELKSSLMPAHYTVWEVSLHGSQGRQVILIHDAPRSTLPTRHWDETGQSRCMGIWFVNTGFRSSIPSFRITYCLISQGNDDTLLSHYCVPLT